MLELVQSLTRVALHTVAIYLFLIVGLRFVGRRQLGQLTIIDLVVIILLGSAVETAMVAGNTTLPAGIVSAGTLLLTNRLLAVLAYRSKRIRHFVAGQKMLLVNNGHIVEENLRRSGITVDDLAIAFRARGHCDISEIRYAIMEADGTINVIPRESAPEPLQSDTVIGGVPEAALAV